MPDQTERYVKIYDLTICPARAHGAPPSKCEPSDFGPLRDAVKAAAAANSPLCDEADERGRRLFLMDADVHGRSSHVVFVWTLADPSAAAQMFLKRGIMELRSAAKDDDEDVALSAHMVIDFDVAPESMRYRAALEDHEGISRSRIQSLFQTLLQDHMAPVVAFLEDGITKVGPPKVVLDAHPGRVIKDTSAKPVEIDVVKLTRRGALVADTLDPYYQSVERRVFKLARDGLAAELRTRALEKVWELREIHPGHRIRIRWRDPEKAGIDEITQLDPLDQPERLLERALTRTVRLGGFRSLPDATNTIVPRLAERMLASLRETAADDAKRRPR
jgi:hypothetical protein